MKYLLLFLVSCASWKSEHGVHQPLVGTIWNSSENRKISESELTKDFEAQDYFLLGEKHDNQDHQDLTLKVLRKIHQIKPIQAVVFEHLYKEDEENLKKAFKDQFPKVSELSELLQWSKKGWYNFDSYYEIFHFLWTNHIQILSLGLSENEIYDYRKQKYSPYVKMLISKFSLDEKLEYNKNLEMVNELDHAHCGKIERFDIFRLQKVQRLKDASLASQVAKFSRTLLISGSGHINNRYGVQSILKEHMSKPSLSLAFLEIPQKDQTYTLKEFDFVWFTPRASESDYCESLR